MFNNGLILILATFLLLSCAPTIKKIAKEDLDDFHYQRGVNDGIDMGYNMAIEVAKKEYEDRLYSTMGKFKDHLMYLQLVKGGILEPARVVTELIDGQVSEDGKSYVAPYLKWVIIKDPSFNLDKSLRWRQKDEENYCYLFLSSFDEYKQAMKELSTIQRPSGGYIVLFDIVKQIKEGDKKEKYALVAKTARSYCTHVKDFYTVKGYDVILDIGSPKIPLQRKISN